MAVNIRDVASRAGVSPVVVSRVLHGKAPSVRTSEATAERVRKAAKDLGYRVNVLAEISGARQTMMIGVLHGIGFERPMFDRGSRYFAALMDGIVNGAFRHGYSVTLCPQLLGQSPEDAMSDGRFDGLVWYSTDPSPENRAMLLNCSVPLVLVHAHADELNNKYPTVNCDNAQGIGLAVEHLTVLGHEKIAFAYECDIPNHETTARRAAFEAHAKRYGLEVGAEDLIPFSWQRNGIDKYLAGGPKHTAIMCNTDEVAAEFIQRGNERGLRLPEDLSIVGFDSTAYCNELRPSLTSISQPLSSMGERAIDQLVQVIAGNEPNPLEQTFLCGLDIRGSTAPPFGGDAS